MTWIAVGTGAVTLGTSIYSSAHKAHQAKMLEQGNNRPTYHIPDEFKQNLLLAQNMARIGLPQQQYSNQANAINQNQAGAIAALGNSANPGAGLAQIVRGGNAAFGALNGQDAQARMANQRYAINQNAQMGNQQLAAQQYNQFDKYSENFNRAQALRGAASQDLQNGLNGAMQIGAGLAANGNLGFGGKSGGAYKKVDGQWYGKDVNGMYTPQADSLQASGGGLAGQDFGLGQQGIISNYKIPY